MLLALCCGADAKKVKGSVTCGDRKLEGVIVTDGHSFTRTQKNGKFTFEIKDDAEFVYIVTPSGHAADWSSGVPAFYMPVQGTEVFDFQLQRTAGGQDYHIVAIADPQTYSEEHMEKFSGRPMEDIKKTVNGLTYQAVGLTLGDIAWDNSEMLPKYKSVIAGAGIPFYPVIGNHDYEAFCKGDKESSATYRRNMGPENYAFWLGKDIVIVLDNIIYDTDFKSVNGYSDEIIAWVKELEKMVPSDAEVFIAQHVPFSGGRKKLRNGNALLDIFRGRKVTFLSGHMHRNNNYVIEKNIIEHNIASICGAWWDSDLCGDGTPRGYKVFTREAGALSWYYKPVDHPKEHMVQSYGLGQDKKHPNSIVLNVWDWDPQWKVEWYEDGINRGKMDARGGHFFTATPGRYAEVVTVSVTGRFGQKWVHSFKLSDYEEKTKSCVSIEDAKAAVDEGVNMIHMTLHHGADGQVYAGSPEGETLAEVLDAVEAYTAEQGCSPIRYHLEFTQDKRYDKFIDAAMQELWPRFLGDRLLITCPEGLMKKFLMERFPEVYISDNNK